MNPGFPRVGFLHCGSPAQLATLRDPAVVVHRPTALYLLETDESAVADLDVLIVADRLRNTHLRERSDIVLSVAERGGTVVVLGENEIDTWLPGLRRHEPCAINYWWWRTGEDPGIRMRNPGHQAWNHLSEFAVRWHYHGLLTPPEGATALVVGDEEAPDSSVLLYEDRVSTPGRLIVTTMDPVYHHGSGFMPGATQLLYGLLRWTTSTTS